jgi:hypothetical protein
MEAGCSNTRMQERLFGELGRFSFELEHPAFRRAPSSPPNGRKEHN